MTGLSKKTSPVCSQTLTHSNHHHLQKLSTKMFRISKPQPLKTLSSHLLQRCSVSKTPKGKVKEGQTIKKSKLAAKKVPNPDAKPLSRHESEKQKLYDACINAPTPVRYIKPQLRAREAEREKLGLESKERIKEKEILKKGGKEALGVPDEPLIMGTAGLDYVTLGLVDADKIPKYDLTVEDGRRLAKECSRILMREHRLRQKGETNLLRCKKEAIEALPDHLKTAALVPDLTPFPANRFMATLTPPIEGYNDKVNEATKRTSASQKIR